MSELQPFLGADCSHGNLSLHWRVKSWGGRTKAAFRGLMPNTNKGIISSEVGAGVAETGSLQQSQSKFLYANLPSSGCLFRCHTFLVILTGTNLVRSFKVFLGRDEGRHSHEHFKGRCLQEMRNFDQVTAWAWSWEIWLCCSRWQWEDSVGRSETEEFNQPSSVYINQVNLINQVLLYWGALLIFLC